MAIAFEEMAVEKDAETVMLTAEEFDASIMGFLLRNSIRMTVNWYRGIGNTEFVPTFNSYEVKLESKKSPCSNPTVVSMVI